MPYQMDWLLRAPYPDNPSGWYYWTNSWILNTSTDGGAINRANTVGNWLIANTSTICQRVRRQFKRAPGRGGVYFVQSTANLPGTYPAGTAGYTLLMHVRIEWLSGQNTVGYKRWRMPLRMDQLHGKWVDPALITHMTTTLNTMLAVPCLSSLSGQTVDGFRILPDARMWQLRHGTKRSESVVIA